LKLTKSTVIHPFLFAIFPIIFLFSQNLNVEPEKIVLPILIVIIVTLVFWIVLSFLLKSRIKSGFIVSLGLVIFFSYGHIYILLDAFQPNLSHFILIIPTLVLFGLGSYYFIRTKNPLNNATKVVNGIAAALIVMSLVGAGGYFMTDSYSPNEIENDLEKNVFQNINSSKFPDVYYIILDGYAGSESLQTIANYDNSNFLDFLTKKGFYVASESFTNYPHTTLSIPSTLNMRYFDYLYKEPTNPKSLYKELLKISRDNAVIKNFKSKGYTIYAIEAGSAQTSKMKNVDYRLCTRENLSITEFHSMLIRTTMLNPIQGKLFSSPLREQILCGFSELSNVENKSDSPKFVIAHLMIPHQPFVFGPNGEPLFPKILTLENKEESFDQDLYLGQLQFVNIKMKDVIKKLTETENPPVIIIQSDHGMRHGDTQGKYEHMLKVYNNLKAYYFPAEGRNIEFEKTTSVNSFRVFFNLYFDDEYEILEDRIFNEKLEDGKLVGLRDLTDYLIKNNSET